MGFLSDEVAEVRRDLARRPLDDGALMSRAAVMPPTRGFAEALRRGRPALIAEVKRSSPSAGWIAEAEPSEWARVYEDGGAAAISVLTEGRHFGGTLADLQAVRVATSVPVLRKDFLVHPSQLIEARANGADAVLLIAACLSSAELGSLLVTAADLGLDVLLEAHSEADLDKALATPAEVVGVNARDLETLEVDEGRAVSLLGTVPANRVAVFESGVFGREQVERAVAAGASAVLVGEALMRAEDPAATIRELMGTGM